MIWDPKERKGRAGAQLRQSCWLAVTVCFLAAFVAGEFAESMDFVHRNAGEGVTGGGEEPTYHIHIQEPERRPL